MGAQTWSFVFTTRVHSSASSLAAVMLLLLFFLMFLFFLCMPSVLRF